MALVVVPANNRYQRRGGAHDLRNQLWNSRAWHRAKVRVKKRDDYRCQGYGPHRGRLTVHHILAVLDRPDLMLDDDNLITLCSACHGRIDGRRSQGGDGSTRGRGDGSPGSRPRRAGLEASGVGNRFKGTVI